MGMTFDVYVIDGDDRPQSGRRVDAYLPGSPMSLLGLAAWTPSVESLRNIQMTTAMRSSKQVILVTTRSPYTSVARKWEPTILRMVRGLRLSYE